MGGFAFFTYPRRGRAGFSKDDGVGSWNESLLASFFVRTEVQKYFEALNSLPRPLIRTFIVQIPANTSPRLSPNNLTGKSLAA
jgi:hypothetical protein